MFEPKDLVEGVPISYHQPLHTLTTLRAGGSAEMFSVAKTGDELAAAIALAHRRDWPLTILGGGSNMLPSDDGVPGLIVMNLARTIKMLPGDQIFAETGCWIQDVFLFAAQRGLKGLEYAVGIPGTLGGALVSNAGAYRSNISSVVTELDVVERGERKMTDAGIMGFAYRDSVLRKENPPKLGVISVVLQLSAAPRKAILDDARNYQRQRISKQPTPASAGSFFKNVEDFEFAQQFTDLNEGMRANGVVPAGYLIEKAGLKGFRLGGAMLGARHANFILNVGAASAFEIRRLAQYTKGVVEEKFGRRLEEEVLYLGDWSRFTL
jgi:UDP-N-acetylmuramate dehydrogenase